MRTGTPVFDEDRYLVELVVKKTSSHIVDFLSMGSSACLSQFPSPTRFFSTHKEVFSALAVTIRCVRGPVELAYVLAQIEDSSHIISDLLVRIIDQFATLTEWKCRDLPSLDSTLLHIREMVESVIVNIDHHCRLVGSPHTIDRSIIRTCQSILEGLSNEFRMGLGRQISLTHQQGQTKQ
jgi:hypothetical protein